MKTKNLVAVIVVGNLAGAVLTSFFTLTFRSSWPLATPLCRCGWAVLAFPLGWLGLIAGKFFASPQMAYLLFGAGLLSNACLWGWMAARIIRAVQQQGAHKGFDASTFSPRIAQLRRTHDLAAHSRSRQFYARKGLLAAANRTVRRFVYFSSIRTEGQEPADKEIPKLEP